MRRVIVLGSTGSIGVSTLQVIEHLNREGEEQFQVVGLAAYSSQALISQQSARWGNCPTAITSPTSPVLPGSFTGPQSALQLIDAIARPGDIVVGAMVGASGIAPTLAAIERGCHIALANKETLVAAGSIVTQAARRMDVNLLPIDSEHSAVHQCLRSSDCEQEILRVVLTASGGPFRQATLTEMEQATPAQALRHPTWKMGRKVSIDSATMMNKTLEIIEAHWLFGLAAEQIDAVLHPQSIVHSFVEFVDGSTIAQLSPPDMKLPIQYALTWPKRVLGCAKRLEWSQLGQLEFSAIDPERFPAVSLAHQVIRAGGTAGAILNAANETAVEAFLCGRITFPMVARIAAEALGTVKSGPASSLEAVLAADAEARSYAARQIESLV
ncbi:MAG: 1-deoxy-D-xylulose-5-phosphate reductoisomerase [Phycisphaerales bacterium]|nr:1-deoxy-D-xylulose-5-phosphate reductoisomerase [Phycisphaerales bacterium]